MSVRIFSLVTALFTALLCFALPAQAQSLTDVVSKAVTTHPQAESSKAALGIAGQDLAEQHSAYFPDISVNASAGRMYGDNSTSRGLSTTRGAGYSNIWEGSVTGRQMIFDAGETENRLGSARAGREAARLDLQDVRENLAFRVTQTYVNLMRAREGHRMIRDYKAKVDGYLQQIQSLVEEGAADEAELQQARDVLITLQGFEADYQGQIQAAEADFAELTGDFPAGDLSLPGLPESLLPEDRETAVEVAKAEHASIRSARMALEAARYGIDAEESALYPDVDGELSLLKSEKKDLLGGEVEDARALLRMSWALETGGAQKARIRRKRFEHRSAMADLLDAERHVEHDIRLSYAERDTALAQFKNRKQRTVLNETLFSTYETQFEGAIVSLLQMMQASNQLFSARLEEMNAQYRYALSLYSILANMGRLQAALGVVHSEDAPSPPAPDSREPDSHG